MARILSRLHGPYAGVAAVSMLGTVLAFASVFAYGLLLAVDIYAAILFALALVEVCCSLSNAGSTQFLQRYIRQAPMQHLRWALSVRLCLLVLLLGGAFQWLPSGWIPSYVQQQAMPTTLWLLLTAAARLLADANESLGAIMAAQWCRALPALMRLPLWLGCWLLRGQFDFGAFLWCECLTAVLMNLQALVVLAAGQRSEPAEPVPASLFWRSLGAMALNDYLYMPVSPFFARVLAGPLLSATTLALLGTAQTFVAPLSRYSPPVLLKGVVFAECTQLLSQGRGEQVRARLGELRRWTWRYMAYAGSACLAAGVAYSCLLQPAQAWTASTFLLLGSVGALVLALRVVTEIRLQLNEQLRVVVIAAVLSCLVSLPLLWLAQQWPWLWMGASVIASSLWLAVTFFLAERRR